MAKAPVATPFTFPGFEDVEAGIVKWPMSVVRIASEKPERLIDLADNILGCWRGYTDESTFIFAETDGEPHNTITPIARRRGDKFELDLVLRNNITTEEHPLGVYHPHAELHHIKKENTTQQFKDTPGSVLLATGAVWEGFDFPGDCVSLLVIPRLPFAHPDALKEKKRAEYPDLHSFIRAVVVPEMQIKLKQGFGRAIRTETDTCVVSVLDERATPGQRHFEAMRAALPEMQMTNSLEDVVDFIYRAKGTGYFKEGES